jgi:hypothetical protein
MNTYLGIKDTDIVAWVGVVVFAFALGAVLVDEVASGGRGASIQLSKSVKLCESRIPFVGLKKSVRSKTPADRRTVRLCELWQLFNVYPLGIGSLQHIPCSICHIAVTVHQTLGYR